MAASAAPSAGRTLLAAAVIFGVTALAAAAGAAASIQAPEFYRALARPAWAPPSWLFGPVWTLLYALMALAATIVWRESAGRARGALTLYAVQLALNALWTWLFFAWRSGALAFAEILVLLAAIVATIVAFNRVKTIAAVLLLPYLAWTLFATALTLAVWRANPGVL